MSSPTRFGPDGSANSLSNRDASAQTKRLTPREREVVSWIAAGKRNAEIAEILGCSTRTVKKHMEHIFFKLGLESRTGVCTWWHEQGKAASIEALQQPTES